MLFNYAIIFTISFSSLAFEVILVRFFGITQWNHLSFMIISIALLGFTASGIFINIASAKNKFPDKYLREILVFFSVTLLISFLYINNIPLDFFKLSTNPVQLLYLILSFIILSLPFFSSGLITGILFSSIPQKAGGIYFANMSGSACGALFPLITLLFFRVESVIFISGAIPLLLLVFDFSEKNKNITRIFSSGLLLIYVLVYFLGISAVAIEPSPYKLLSQYKQIEKLEIISEIDTPRARITYISSPYIRYSPGLSLKFTGQIPKQSSIITDGNSSTTLYHQFSEDDNFIHYTLPYAGYILLTKKKEPNNILIIQKGGGTGIYTAISSETADKITVIEEYPEIAKIMESHYSSSKTDFISENARTYLACNNTKYDLIQLDYWGSSIPGMLSLNEEYFLTVEAFRNYLFHLSENGIIVVSRKILMPPSDSLKIINTANEAFCLSGRESINNNLIVLRNWDSFTLLIFKMPVTSENLNIVLEFAENLNFDIVYYPGIREEETNRFNIFTYPFYYNAVSELLSNKNFDDNYLLNINAQTDNKPFHYSYLKWDRIVQLIKESGNRFFSIILSGEMILVFIFLSALLICIILLIIPIIFSSGKFSGHIFYFLSIGAGFMFLEIAFLKKIMFVLGDPVLSFGIVLAVLLFFSGLGGRFSGKLKYHILKRIIIIIVILSIILFLFFNLITSCLIKEHRIIQISIPILILAVISFFIGFPFPAALKLLLKKPAQIAYCWAANGCTSVLISILSTFIAMNTGIISLFIFSAVSYLFALLSLTIIVKKQ